MKGIAQRFQDMMTAATFAEAGEWGTASEMTPEMELSREPTWLSRVFMAVTFAESGLHREALHLLNPVLDHRRKVHSSIAESLGLKGVRLMYGTVSI